MTKPKEVVEKPAKKNKNLITPEDLFNMEAAIGLMNGLLSADLGAKRARLRRLIKQDVTEMRDFMETEEWKRITKLYVDIDEKYAKKDVSGNIKRTEQGNIILDVEQAKEREEAIALMKKENKEAIDEHEKIWKKYVEDMSVPKIDISEYSKIPFEMFPKETRTEIIDWLDPVIIYKD